jgi:membrane protein
VALQAEEPGRGREAEAIAGHDAGGAGVLAYRALAWPLLFVALCLGLAALYRYGPSRDRAKWRWVTWGSVFAASAWLGMSVGFSLYAANFGSFDRTTARWARSSDS